MNDSLPTITSRAEFAAAIRWGFAHADAQAARRIVCVDPDFADWPLDEPALLDALTAWLKRPQRKLVLLAADYDEVPRRHPRFVAWRASWAHAVDTFSPAEHIELPTLLLDDGDLSVQLVDRTHWRGRVETDRRSACLWRDEVDAVLQRCEPAFPVYRLGL
jgi:hypothetical protein